MSLKIHRLERMKQVCIKIEFYMANVVIGERNVALGTILKLSEVNSASICILTNNPIKKNASEIMNYRKNDYSSLISLSSIYIRDMQSSRTW